MKGQRPGVDQLNRSTLQLSIYSADVGDQSRPTVRTVHKQAPGGGAIVNSKMHAAGLKRGVLDRELKTNRVGNAPAGIGEEPGLPQPHTDMRSIGVKAAEGDIPRLEQLVDVLPTLHQ